MGSTGVGFEDRLTWLQPGRLDPRAMVGRSELREKDLALYRVKKKVRPDRAAAASLLLLAVGGCGASHGRVQRPIDR